MMISPQSYIMEQKNASFEQLIKEKNSLVKEIKDLEKITFSKDRSDSAWATHPGPDVRYQTCLKNLAKLCNFLSEKYNREIVWGETSDMSENASI